MPIPNTKYFAVGGGGDNEIKLYDYTLIFNISIL